MSPTFYQIVTMVFAGVAAICAVFVARRAQRWRETDDAKALIGRVGQVENRTGTLERDAADAQLVAARVGSVENRVTVLEVEVKDLPTKSDIAELRGKVNTAIEIGSRTEKAVDRIESFMMERTS